MAEPDAPSAAQGGDALADTPSLKRRGSSSQQSETSQTAADFIREQMQLEADAREALPYSIKDCTRSLGSLRQAVFSCLTCNPPPSDPKAPYDAAGVCYSCSIQCHGEHTLVEIFTKRNFTCDCGTTRFSSTSPCTLRVNPETSTKGVHSEPKTTSNKYNHNFRNRFCGCECDYDPFEQKGTMFQCLGLGTHETGGCGEDWWHPGCLVGLGPAWFEKMEATKSSVKTDTGDTVFHHQPLETISEDVEAVNGANTAITVSANADPPAVVQQGEEDDPPMPPGFPDEGEFESFLCYKCVDAYPWTKRYAGSRGFLPPIFSKQATDGTASILGSSAASAGLVSQKRKAEHDDGDAVELESKRHKTEEPASAVTSTENPPNAIPLEKPVCKTNKLPSAPSSQFSLFLKEDFRDHLCRCEACFPLLKPHPQLLEEEETYEPPVSEDGDGSEHGGSTQGSLLEMGESALRNVDRVRAIEGVMAYNHLKDKLKTFLQPFAQSGEAVSAEHIKEIFAKMRGDDEAIKEAAEGAKKSSDNRHEQSGY